MNSLRRVQELFAAAVFEEDGGPALKELRGFIAPRPGLSAEDHLKVYRRSVLAKLVEALADTHPVCLKLVGERFFKAMARTFVRRTPSRSADLGEYGADFADFIEEFEPAAILPYLPDVARLEWGWDRVFHAEAGKPLDTDALGRIPADQQGKIRFHPTPASVLLESIYPVHRIWQVNQSDYRGDARIDLDEGGVRLMVWRDGFEMRMDPLDEVTWLVLKSFSEDNAFATVCQHLQEQAPNADMADVLPALVQRGWINAFSL